jgi:hypothetical protein
MADSNWQGLEDEEAGSKTYEPPTLTALGALDELTQITRVISYVLPP